jgi:L-serine dehydratase
MTIAEIVLANERALSNDSITKKIINLDEIMQKNIDIGMKKDGVLQGGLNVKRHAKAMYERLKKQL